MLPYMAKETLQVWLSYASCHGRLSLISLVNGISSQGLYKWKREAVKPEPYVIWWQKQKFEWSSCWLSSWKETWAKECVQPLLAEKGKEMDSLFSDSEGNAAHLDFGPVRPILDFWPLCCFKPLYLELLVTAAIGNYDTFPFVVCQWREWAFLLWHSMVASLPQPWKNQSNRKIWWLQTTATPESFNMIIEIRCPKINLTICS